MILLVLVMQSSLLLLLILLILQLTIRFGLLQQARTVNPAEKWPKRAKPSRAESIQETNWARAHVHIMHACTVHTHTMQQPRALTTTSY